jgi:hypothetical protein
MILSKEEIGSQPVAWWIHSKRTSNSDPDPVLGSWTYRLAAVLTVPKNNHFCIDVTILKWEQFFTEFVYSMIIEHKHGCRIYMKQGEGEREQDAGETERERERECVCDRDGGCKKR